jgi:cation diffusion facilitator family transporter
MATTWDYRLDAFGGLAVLLGVAVSKCGGPWWHWADHVAALVIAATVLWIGVRLLRDNTNDLMDRQAPPDILAAVRRAASSVSGVLGVETLHVRKAGLEYLVDIHIEVAPDLTVKAGHAIAHAVKDHIRNTVGALRDVLVHVAPHGQSAGVTRDADARREGGRVRGRTHLGSPGLTISAHSNMKVPIAVAMGISTQGSGSIWMMPAS